MNDTTPFGWPYVLAAVGTAVALVLGVLLLGLLWHRVIVPALDRADDRIADAVDAMNAEAVRR